MDMFGWFTQAVTRLADLLRAFWIRIWFSFFDIVFWFYHLLPGSKSMKRPRKIVKYLISLPIIGTLINWLLTHYFATATAPRPRPYSLWSASARNTAAYRPLPDPMSTTPPLADYGPVSNYTSWNSLTNKKFSARHLPPAKKVDLPALEDVAALFKRPPGNNPTPDRSSLFFAFFAQWFTDIFMRVDPEDRRKNTSNHDIDLCQIYGLDELTCDKLRSKRDGKLRSQIINGEEFPEYLGEIHEGTWRVKEHFQDLPYAQKIDQQLGAMANDSWRKEKLYATGLERGNSSIGYAAISILFLREHNRICNQLVRIYGDPQHTEYAHWNPAGDAAYFDERVFQTARMINTVILLKLVVEEYINHVAGDKAFKLDYGFAEELNWYRTNWITIEFDLLYRWHSLAVAQIDIGNQPYLPQDYRFNNGALESLGLHSLIEAVSTQQAGRIGLQNTPDFLWRAEMFALKMARDFNLQSYNDYREKFGLRRLSSILELVGDDPGLCATLDRLYDGDINKVEYLVGIFAEQREAPALFGELMYNMVSYDAFTHIYTNPLLSKNIYGEKTFTPVGMKIINDTQSLTQFVSRNLGGRDVAVRFG
jgi:prostaglandin-endoperoxide synthase 2